MSDNVVFTRAMALQQRMTAEPFGPAAAFLLTDEQVAELGGGRRPPVVVEVGDKSARVRVSVMGGKNCIGLSKANRAVLGVEIGDTVDVRISLDDQPREVEVPPELAAAWADRPEVAEAFAALAFTHRREFTEWVAGAKQQATRDRRAAKAVEMIADKQTRS